MVQQTFFHVICNQRAFGVLIILLTPTVEGIDTELPNFPSFLQHADMLGFSLTIFSRLFLLFTALHDTRDYVLILHFQVCNSLFKVYDNQKTVTID